MLKQTTELAQILQKLFSYYQKALDLGNQVVRDGGDSVESALDERYRILQRTTPLAQKAKELKAILMTQPLTPSEKAFILEQQKRVRDLLPRFGEQERTLQGILRKHLVSARGNLVQHNQNMQAIRTYLAAPGSKPLV